MQYQTQLPHSFRELLQSLRIFTHPPQRVVNLLTTIATLIQITLVPRPILHNNRHRPSLTFPFFPTLSRFRQMRPKPSASRRRRRSERADFRRVFRARRVKSVVQTCRRRRFVVFRRSARAGAKLCFSGCVDAGHRRVENVLRFLAGGGVA